MGTSNESGKCFEAGPRGSRIVNFMDYMDEETRLGCEAATFRSGRLWKDS